MRKINRKREKREEKWFVILFPLKGSCFKNHHTKINVVFLNDRYFFGGRERGNGERTKRI